MHNAPEGWGRPIDPYVRSGAEPGDLPPDIPPDIAWRIAAEQHQRRSRLPTTLTAAATVAAAGSWVAVAAVFLIQHLPDTVHDISSFFAFLIYGVFVIALLFCVVVAGCLVAIVGGVATLPLAIGWFRHPKPRPLVAGVALAHAVVACAVLGYVMVTVVL